MSKVIEEGEPEVHLAKAEPARQGHWLGQFRGRQAYARQADQRAGGSQVY